jgi:hypothetical protein
MYIWAGELNFEKFFYNIVYSINYFFVTGAVEGKYDNITIYFFIQSSKWTSAQLFKVHVIYTYIILYII